jgi:hypothetical protein
MLKIGQVEGQSVFHGKRWRRFFRFYFWFWILVAAGHAIPRLVLLDPRGTGVAHTINVLRASLLVVAATDVVLVAYLLLALAAHDGLGAIAVRASVITAVAVNTTTTLFAVVLLAVVYRVVAVLAEPRLIFIASATPSLSALAALLVRKDIGSVHVIYLVHHLGH